APFPPAAWSPGGERLLYSAPDSERRPARLWPPGARPAPALFVAEAMPGETVYEVSPGWTAEGRRSARRPGKSDALDPLAGALHVRRAAAPLPAVGAEDETAVLDLLTTERDAAVAEGTRLRNQLPPLLLQLDPKYRAHLPALATMAGLAAVEGYTTA